MSITLLSAAIMAISTAAGTSGTVMGAKGASKSKIADLIQEEAETILKNEQENLTVTRELTSEVIQLLGELKLEASSEDIDKFVKTFSQIKNIELGESVGLDEISKMNLTNESLKEMKKVSIDAKEIISGSAAGLGSGILLGWGSYGGVMALGTASTGTAIGSLSGAAATNATLAWLGGGSLASGGGGIALGTQVLGGVVAGPAILLAGGIYKARSNTKLNNSYSNLAQAKVAVAEMKKADAELKVISRNAYQLNNLFNVIRQILREGNTLMKEIVDTKTEWSAYTVKEKNVVASTTKAAQLVKALIDIPLLTDDGILTQEIRNLQGNIDVTEAYESKTIGAIELENETVKNEEIPEHLLRETSSESLFEEHVDLKEAIIEMSKSFEKNIASSVYIGNEHIPRRKLNSAKVKYAGAVPVKDVLVLVDDHVLKTGGQGVIITSEAMYISVFGKMMGQGKIPFKEIVYAEIDEEDDQYFKVHTHDGLLIDSTNSNKFYAASNASLYVEFLNAIVELIPFSVENESNLDEAELIEKKMHTLVKQWSQNTKSTYNIYHKENIPHKKLTNAIKTYANLVDRDNVIGLFDTTLFGNGKAGALITNKSMYIKMDFEKPGKESIKFDRVKRAVLKDENKFYVEKKSGRKVDSGTSDQTFRMSSDANEFVDFINQASEIHK
ncbi:hypothetical protein AB4027_04715 [Alkalibacterium putridalgicola]|uniref:hypothetical protein n=1 Tax=Alkalibacterium putridalgicola TaxID=426703 RepID=UPI0034CE0339